ncbi:MAG TPA: DNA repair protein RadC, partial [Candidatus Dojkabacteria bacterium]|nr:DNA repair protein RadC [Candidatus Dojkabacteria bacterium]
IEGKNVFSISKRVEKVIQNNASLGSISVQKFQEIKGIGKVKAQRLSSALELGKRIYNQEVTKILSTRDVWLMTKSMTKDCNEKVIALYLNGRNQLLDTKEIASGGGNSSFIDMRLLIKRALELMASGIILVHNHPSGNVKPSNSDLVATQTVRSACDLMGIKLLDHVIVAEDEYTSISA